MTKPTPPTRGREFDKLARDLLGVVAQIHAGVVLKTYLATAPTRLVICTGCGSLERDNRTCQVCRARRAAARVA